MSTNDAHQSDAANHGTTNRGTTDRGESPSDARKPDAPDRDTIASEYFDALPYEPYPVQEEALLAYFGDVDTQGVLVCAPTGTGKTMIAEAAVYEALRTGTRMYYTTPLIALTDQKLDELRQSAVRWGFKAEDVGLVTGNRSVNADANVLVVVAEILLNRLLNPERFSFDDTTAVVMDEFHSFNDPERGIVWELTLSMLPPHVRTLLLSATVGNAVEFTSWLYRNHNRRLKLVSGDERKVPLQYHWIDDKILADLVVELADGDAESRRTPALLFCFSRSQCWTTAELLRGKPLIQKSDQAKIAEFLNGQDLSNGVGPKLKSMLLRGVGVHHAGVLPRYRRIVETLFQQKLLAYCVCTETLAAGINLPARSVILPSILKGPPKKLKLIDTASAQQIFGRAGRPQYDDRGYVYALAHEDDVKHNLWRLKYDAIDENSKDPGLMKARKQLKKKMPKRRAGQTYWSLAQFEQLQTAAAADLSSRGRWPWRLLAYLIGRNSDLKRIREMVAKRLLPPAGKDTARRELNRMLVTLHGGGFIALSPPPTPRKSSSGQTTAKPGGSDASNPFDATRTTDAPGNATSRGATGGLFGEILDQMRTDAPEPIAEAVDDADISPPPSESGGPVDFEIDDYVPDTAEPTVRLPELIQIKTCNPLLGLFVSDLLVDADDAERVAVLESMLEVPRTVARWVRVPDAEELPRGTLETETLDPQLLQLGLATPEELGAVNPDEDEDNRPRGFDEPKVWPLTIGEKVHRLFGHQYPRVEDARVTPVWIVGRLMEFEFNFNNFVTSSKLQKDEGILFRHCLRMVLLLDEMAGVPPPGTTVETWEYWMDDLAERLTEMCRRVDPQSTEEGLTSAADEDDAMADTLRGTGRRAEKRGGPTSDAD